MKALIFIAVSSQAQSQDDKISLEDQERLCREWCEEQDIDVLSVLSVPGYSRRESDLITALEDFETQGVTAYRDLRSHWQRRDFDVLVAYHPSRFGRSTTLHSYVIENTINSGARVFLLHGGWIDKTNYRFQTAMGGYSATTEVDRLVQARRAWVENTLKKKTGKPVTSRLIMSHERVYNERGQLEGIRLKPGLERLWQDLADAILSGISYTKMGQHLYERGHSRNDGKPYDEMWALQILHNPQFWGHTAVNHHRRGSKYKWRGGPWIFGPEYGPAPAGVLVSYNTHEAVYTGALADKIIAELLRRKEVTKGRGKPVGYKLAGLFVCAYCGYYLTMYQAPMGQRNRYLRCRSRKRRPETNCPSNKMLKEYQAIEFIDALINSLSMASERTTRGIEQKFLAHMVDDTQAAIERDIEALERRIEQTIIDKADAPANTRGLYDKRLNALSEQLGRLTDLLADEIKRGAGRHTQERVQGYEALKDIELWELPDFRVNQLLHRLFSGLVIEVKDGVIVGLRDK